nr:hypothetical protein [Limosilactobacillus mucosae]
MGKGVIFRIHRQDAFLTQSQRGCILVEPLGLIDGILPTVETSIVIAMHEQSCCPRVAYLRLGFRIDIGIPIRRALRNLDDNRLDSLILQCLEKCRLIRLIAADVGN